MPPSETASAGHSPGHLHPEQEPARGLLYQPSRPRCVGNQGVYSQCVSSLTDMPEPEARQSSEIITLPLSWLFPHCRAGEYSPRVAPKLLVVEVISFPSR